MIKEARGFGNDIFEAQEDARKNLGVSVDADVQFEIITQSKKKVLGIFGGSKAEVRAFVEIPDAPQKKVKAPKQDKQKKQEAPVQKKNEAPKRIEEEKKEAAPKPVKEAATEKQAKKESAAEKFEDIPKLDELKDESLIEKDSKTYKAIAYLKNILKEFGCENITFKALEKDNSAFIWFDGEGVGAVIGRRGETLDALQYLSGLAANDFGGYFKVSLNIGDYREKREQALVSLANKVARQVLETGRSRALEPMNPYERRIIHTAIQRIGGVVSNSIGEGSARRVVVYSENGDSRPPRFSNDRGSRGGNRGGRGGRRPNRPDNTVSTTPSREPKKDNDIPLYGKIN